MVRAKNQARLYVDKLVPGKKPATHSVLHSFHRRLVKLARYGTTRDLVFEDKAFARCRLDLELNMCELPATACLLLKYLFARRVRCDRLAICDLRLTDIRLDTEFALH